MRRLMVIVKRGLRSWTMDYASPSEVSTFLDLFMRQERKAELLAWGEEGEDYTRYQGEKIYPKLEELLQQEQEEDDED